MSSSESSALASPRPLLTLELSAFGMPAGVLSRALGAAAGSTVFFWASCAGPGLPYVAAWFGVMFLFILAVLLGPALFKAARTRVGLDEGGVRCKMGGYSTYYPFDLVGLGSLGVDASGIPSLILEDRTDRPFLKVPLLDQGAQASARAFIAEYERRRLERPVEVPRTASLLARNGRRIREWIAALEDLAASAGQVGYRAQGIDPVDLEALVQDVRHDASQRAAAAFTLLATKDPRARDIVEAAVSESAPPLVLLLVRAAKKGVELVSDDLLARVRDYLDSEDD